MEGFLPADHNCTAGGIKQFSFLPLVMEGKKLENCIMYGLLYSFLPRQKEQLTPEKQGVGNFAAKFSFKDDYRRMVIERNIHVL